MSYASVNPSYWQALQPDGPWEAGAPGWKSAPFVGWGHNPDRSLPPLLATDGCSGLGCAPKGCGCSGVGADAPVSVPVWPVLVGYAAVGLLIWGAFRYAAHAERR